MPMSKGLLIAIAYSVVVLILFGVSIFLMSTVNPEPLKDDVTGAEEPGSEQMAALTWPDVEGDDYLIKPLPSSEITSPAENNMIKDRRSVRYPARRNKSKHVILEIADDKGSPRVQILLYPKRPLKQRSRKIRKNADFADFITSRKQGLDNVVDESDSKSIVKIWPDDTVSFGEEDILIPADVTQFSIYEENTTGDLYKETPTSELIIDHSLGTLVSGEVEDHVNGSDTTISTLTGNVSVNSPIENSMVDYTHASVKKNLDSIKTNIVQEMLPKVANTPPPIFELSSETNTLHTDEPVISKSKLDDIYTKMPTVQSPLDNQALFVVENAVSDSDTKAAPIPEESFSVDLDSEVQSSTKTDVLTNMVISEQTLLDDMTIVATEIIESDSLDSEVTISIPVEDYSTVVPISEQSADLLDIKIPEEIVTGINESLPAEITPNESNTDEANILNSQQGTPATEETVDSETNSVIDSNVQKSVIVGDEETITSESPSSLSQPGEGNSAEVSEESAAGVISDTQEAGAQSKDDSIFKD